MTLSELRRALVTAKDALRTAKEDHATLAAICEQRAINDGATGKNAEERERALRIALDKDGEYLTSRDRLDSAEYEVERLQVKIAILEDDRKARELTCRERNNEALDRYAAALERLASQRPVTMAVDATLPF